MIRTWLKFLNRSAYQEQPPAAPSDPATAGVPPAPPTTVMQVVAEETIMAVAHWLVNLLHHSIQPKPVTPTEPPPEPVAPPATTTTEELLSRFGTLIEQLSDRDQKLLPLEQRIQRVEAVSTREADVAQQLRESMLVIDRLSQRLIRVEDLAGRVNVFEIDGLMQQQEQLTQRLDHSHDAIALFDLRLMQLESQLRPQQALNEQVTQMQQNLTVLDHRVNRLEKLLARLSLMPKLVEENRQAIAALHHQLIHPPFEQNGHLKHLDADQECDRELHAVTSHRVEN